MGEAARTKIAELAMAHPDAVVMISNAQGTETLAPPDWLAELFTDFRQPPTPVDLVAAEQRIDAVGMFYQARMNGECVSATRLVDNPSVLQRCHTLRVDHWNDVVGVDPIFVFICVPDDSATTERTTAFDEAVAPRRIVYRADAAGVALTFDPSAQTLMGWTKESFVGQSGLDRMHPSDVDTAVSRWLHVLQTEGGTLRGRTQYKTSAGEWRWFESTETNLLAAEGYVLVELLDISVEMQALSELRAREELLLRLTDALPSGVVHFDRHGALLFANDRLDEITGVHHPVLRSYLELFDVDTQQLVTEVAESAYAEGSDFNLEATLHRKDGTTRHVRLSLRSLAVDEQGANGLLICVDDITDEWLLRVELARRADRDDLTGVANRAAVHTGLAEALRDRRSIGTGAIYFDLNGFKAINDAFGHAIGDELLQETANRLAGAARDSDIVGRLGGDEFIVICPETTADQVAALAQRLLDAVNDLDADAPTLPPIVASCGYSHILHDNGLAAATTTVATDPDKLIAEADAAMYAHKRDAGNRPLSYATLALDDKAG